MVYRMEWYVDGGCRGNGKPSSIGGAAAVLKKRFGRCQCWAKALPRDPTPTNQKAEITALVMALEKSLERYDMLDKNRSPRLLVKIHSDSKYVIGCMTLWLPNWVENGWKNSGGKPVANRELIQKASALNDRLKEKGRVKYVWVPRNENQLADRLCNVALDEQSEDFNDSWSSYIKLRE